MADDVHDTVPDENDGLQHFIAASPSTDIVPDEHYRTRIGDLGGLYLRRVAGQKRKRPPPSPIVIPPVGEDVDMGEASQPTQQATQPFEDPRRLGRHLSDVSESDITDVICLLHPNSPAAFRAVKANMLRSPQHILQNDDLEGIVEDDLMLPQYEKGREFALRLSSHVKIPSDGFRFGRNAQSCDILLTDNIKDKLISNTHFKIFINSQGSLMLQDLSTNGTIVDDDHLKGKKNGHLMPKPATRALKNGAIICIVGEPNRTEIKLMVRIPNRGDFEDAYEQKLRNYLAARGKVAQFASMRESSYGNHWNGGTTYNFTGLLGKGAFATVYRVQTKMEGNMFAAKELDKRRFIKNGILDIKFDSELKIMKYLKHPNIVEYIDCQHHENWIYIIMEYIPYGELAQEIRDRDFLPEMEVQQIARQIVHALQYLHRRNITHRDIKPDNILIASRDPLIVKLSDFGLSKCVTDQETFLKTFCGTLLYCAPEVYPDYNNYAQGMTPKRRRAGEPSPKTSPYDQSVDMWSFGAVIFHLLCGKAPITGRGDDRGAQMLNNIMTKDVDFEPLRKRGVSEQAIDFVSRLLNRNPYLRPKEPECLNHPWLRNVPDHFEYEKEPSLKSPSMILGAMEEVDEDVLDEELIKNLGQLTQPPVNSSSSRSTPSRAVKRPRVDLGATFSPEPVNYPVLPSNITSSPPAGGRLFGEIGQSVLRSSGVFGDQVPQTVTPGGVPELQHRVEQISVNDFGTFSSVTSIQTADNLAQPQREVESRSPQPDQPTGAAPSLLGAELQIGQLNMASPDAEASEGQTPDTNNPVTPRTREISPSSSVSKSIESGTTTLQRPEVGAFSRHIDLDLVGDNEAFAAEIAARDASRAENLRIKAETFAARSRLTQQSGYSKLMKTTENLTGEETTNPREVEVRSSTSFTKPLKRFGRLTSIPGSFADITIDLEDRMTTWGRGIDCTVPYEDRKDTRVPKFAMKIAYWAPGIEKFADKGGDWKHFAGVHTILATSATGCIWVNGVKLSKENENGDAALFGKIYTGDIITIYDNPADGTFLKFKVEITFGDSAKPRPDSEKGFTIQEERKYHQLQKERESMRLSHSDEIITPSKIVA